MPLTPEEIAGHDFVVSIRGYDKASVRRFLGQVAQAYRDLLKQSSSGEDPYGGLGEEVAQVVQTAVDNAKQLRARAEEQIAELRQAADLEAERLRKEAAAALEEARTTASEIVADATARARDEVGRMVDEARRRYEQLDHATDDVAKGLEALATSVTRARNQVKSTPRLGETLASVDPGADESPAAAPSPEPAPTPEPEPSGNAKPSY